MKHLKICYVQRIIAAGFFLFWLGGLVLYPFEIENEYILYSILMMAAYLIGALFGTKLYRSVLGLIAEGVFLAAMAFTLNYAIEDLTIVSKVGIQAMATRFVEILLLLSLVATALLTRRSAIVEQRS